MPTIIGTDGDDTLDGTNAADLIEGLGGADSIVDGGQGQDTIRGGGGNDAITVIRNASQSAQGTVADGGDGDDILYYSTVRGTAAVLLGGAGDDLILAVRGPVTVDAGPGDDRVYTGLEGGSITLGAGADIVGYSSNVPPSLTTIVDF